MLNYGDDGYEEEIVNAKILHLISFLDERANYENITEYKILEYFPIDKPEPYYPTTYKLNNLTMETEDGVAYCGDDENILSDEIGHALFGFIIENVIYIAFQDFNNMITIAFEKGYIRIYY